MILVGAGLYLAYARYNVLLFDRMMAATTFRGNAGFLIYVADAAGYCGSITLLFFRNFGHVSLKWTAFLCNVSYVTCIVGPVGLMSASGFLRRSLDDRGRPSDASDPDRHRALARP